MLKCSTCPFVNNTLHYHDYFGCDKGKTKYEHVTDNAIVKDYQYSLEHVVL